jgi:hypothetical protein
LKRKKGVTTIDIAIVGRSITIESREQSRSKEIITKFKQRRFRAIT